MSLEEAGQVVMGQTPMDDKELTRLLQVRDQGPGRAGWRCLSATELAAYVERRVSGRQEARIESHLADCSACLEHVAFLARCPDAGEDAFALPVIGRARDLVGSRPSVWPRLVVRWGTVAAVAACFVFVVSLQLHQPGAPSLLGAAPPTRASATGPRGTSTAGPVATLPPAQLQVPASAGTGTPATAVSPPSPVPPRATVRKSIAGSLSLVLVSPSENSTVLARDLEFRWQAVPAGVYYEVHVVTEEGNVAWQATFEGTSARLPSGHPLETRTKYFVWVRAHLSGGGTVRSAAISFRLRD